MVPLYSGLHAPNMREFHQFAMGNSVEFRVTVSRVEQAAIAFDIALSLFSLAGRKTNESSLQEKARQFGLKGACPLEILQGFIVMLQ